MCGVVKPPRVECGPMHCRLPDQAISETHQHSAVCQVGGRLGAGHRPAARGLQTLVQQSSMLRAIEGGVVGRVKVAGFSLSLDGFGAGTEQSLQDPLGKRGKELHSWFFGTKTFKAMHGDRGGSEGVDEAFAHRSMDGFGGFILGRNMFGPVRGEWPDNSWKGWWGDNPPYHAPTFVLTHHAREPNVMEGGTTFHFVTDGIHAALQRARDAAGARDVKIGGGVSTVRQYLQAGLIDELHFALSPVLLGRGEAMFEGLDLPALGYRVMQSTATDLATHLVLRR
jgi:dihydrofolate reductase